MQKLECVQETICQIVALAPCLANWPFPQGDKVANHIFLDDGTLREEIEASLKAIGWAVVVSPPVGASVQSQTSMTSTGNQNAAGFGYFAVMTNVAVRTNPKKNTGDNKVVPLVAVKQIIQAALNWKPAPSEKGFTLHHELPFSPDFADEGAYTYDIKLMKTVSLL